jgi:hypothetical protein
MSGRWSVTGVDATVLCCTTSGPTRLPADAARSALVVAMPTVAMPTGFEPATVETMRNLEWDVPEFDAPSGDDDAHSTRVGHVRGKHFPLYSY